MSNWGIGLITSPGPGGRPDTLVLRDVEAHCPECGLETVQRFYEATSLHALTLGRLAALLDAGGPAMADTCTQCKAAIGSDDVVRWVLHTGFPGGEGLVQGFGTADGERRWLLAPHRHLDVQLVPEWDATEDTSTLELEALDDAAFERAFGRVCNPKEGARRWLRTLSEDGLRVHRLAPGTWVAAGRGEPDVPAAVAAVEQATRTGRWDAIVLVDRGLPADAWPHAPAQWLAGVELGDRWVVGLCDRDRVAPALERIIATFPVQMPVRALDDRQLELVLPELGDWPEHPRVDSAAVALEAARTLLAVDDMARVELDRLLAALTGLLDGEDDASLPGGSLP